MLRCHETSFGRWSLVEGRRVKSEDEGEEGAFAVDCRTCVDDGKGAKLRCMDFAEKAKLVGSARYSLARLGMVANETA